MTEEELKQAILIAVLGAFLGWILHVLYEKVKTKNLIRSNIDSILQEFAACVEFCNEYLAAGILAPLYRLPIDTFKVSYPLLLEHGLIDKDLALKFILFYEKVCELNRGLDIAHDVYINDKNEKMSDIGSRNAGKAKSIIKMFDDDIQPEIQKRRMSN